MDAVYAVICFIGLALSVVRLKLVAKPGPSWSCRTEWWCWVAVHIGFVVGFSAGVMDVTRNGIEPPFSAWVLRLSLVGLLVLLAARRPRAAQ